MAQELAQNESDEPQDSGATGNEIETIIEKEAVIPPATPQKARRKDRLPFRRIANDLQFEIKEKKFSQGRSLNEAFQLATGPLKWFYGFILSILEFLDDLCMMLAAAVSYFTFFSLFPLILGMAAIGSIFISDLQTRIQIINYISANIPQLSLIGLDIPGLVNGFLDNLEHNRGVLAAIFLLLAFWSGTGIFDCIMNTANRIFEVNWDRRNFFYKLFLRFVMLFGVGGVLLGTYVTSAVLNFLINFGSDADRVGYLKTLFDIANTVFSILLVWGALIILFRFAPYFKYKSWKPVLLGAFVSSVLLQIVRWGFGFYLTFFHGANSYTLTYGAIAGIVLFIFFVYLGSCVLLYGLEVTAIAAGVVKHNVFEPIYNNIRVVYIYRDADKPSQDKPANETTPPNTSA